MDRKKFGASFFSKPDSFFRKPVYMEKAEKFYLKHGKKAIVLARFVPIVRTFAPILPEQVAWTIPHSSLSMHWEVFWCILLIGSGYILGNILPKSGEALTIVILAIIVISLIPVANEAYDEMNKGKSK
ncbi:MAG: hypothetical protein MZV65_30305 [Chromatiales bacterium]|nr:hypothetical protein [Chromatiales bacterium]